MVSDIECNCRPQVVKPKKMHLSNTPVLRWRFEALLIALDLESWVQDHIFRGVWGLGFKGSFADLPHRAGEVGALNQCRNIAYPNEIQP